MKNKFHYCPRCSKFYLFNRSSCHKCLFSFGLKYEWNYFLLTKKYLVYVYNDRTILYARKNYSDYFTFTIDKVLPPNISEIDIDKLLILL